MDAFISMSAIVRVWEQPELDACTARLVMNPFSASDGMHMLICESQLQHLDIDVDGLQVSDGFVKSTVTDVLFLEVVLTLQPTAAPMQMGDIFGNDGVSFRQAAVELFLERHNKRSVVCVSVRDAAQAPGTRTLCTPGVGNAVIIDPNWDIPPFMSSMPPETVVTGLLWPRLRVRLCVTPDALGVRAVADLQRLYVSAWIRDRDDPALVYVQA